MRAFIQSYVDVGGTSTVDREAEFPIAVTEPPPNRDEQFLDVGADGQYQGKIYGGWLLEYVQVCRDRAFAQRGQVNMALDIRGALDGGRMQGTMAPARPRGRERHQHPLGLLEPRRQLRSRRARYHRRAKERPMPQARHARAFALALGLAVPAAGQSAYVPGPGDDWQRKRPDEVGLDPALLQQALDFALASETRAPADLEENHYLTFGREPFGDGIGPFKVRGAMSGIVLRGGYLVAEWGDTKRVDMTYSVTKSFVSTAIGLAWADGLIPNLQAPVLDQMAPMELPAGDGEPGIDRVGFGKPDPTRLFESAHNRTITWDHLLRQTSDWEGTLWGKPDWADRPGDDVAKNRSRLRNAPGSVYKYNDVRVNVLALAGLNLLRRPLPQALKERVMDPIGASRTWRWNGYDNSWINLDGQWVQSVSGGGHWGGGMLISARDQARFGLFTLRRGDWGGKRLLPAQWFEWATTPTGAQRGYGFMNYFLNVPDEQGKKRFPAAPDAAYAHLGNGANVIYVDPVNDLVVVVRWIEASKLPEFVAKVTAALRR